VTENRRENLVARYRHAYGTESRQGLWHDQAAPQREVIGSIPAVGRDFCGIRNLADAAAGQVTAFSSLNCDPGGAGARWMRHRAPPHRSTRSFELEIPTAVQASAAGHATANSLLDADPLGLGVGWMRQLLPFHRSASVS
jgi:hypothetical protein